MIQKISRLAIPLFILLLVNSCTEEVSPEDAVQSLSKNGSVETVVSIENADSMDVLVTKHKVWVKNSLAKEITTRDTIPTLGDTIISVNDNGTKISKTIKKDYEFYITVQ
ncbi:hypothetical protein [Chryseobacterium sp. MP_3.2]|uniref:hypothetical protein n=1 Tax=Chryseobacterium sp. MP_3.2 TaxID=3071712 RepID=UPI002DFF1A3F|nr:hypothetical protein [Chryseobacterium sp. MP_3.2]